MKHLWFVLVIAACGGSNKPAPTQPVAGGDAEHHEMKMAPELAGFHDVLAPHWHAAKGAQRMQDTCTALPAFEKEAGSIASAKPSAEATALGDAVHAMSASCEAHDESAFELAFTKVHETFHGLMKGGEHHMEHEGHGNHEHHMDGEHHDHEDATHPK